MLLGKNDCPALLCSSVLGLRGSQALPGSSRVPWSGSAQLWSLWSCQSSNEWRISLFQWGIFCNNTLKCQTSKLILLKLQWKSSRSLYNRYFISSSRLSLTYKTDRGEREGISVCSNVVVAGADVRLTRTRQVGRRGQIRSPSLYRHDNSQYNINSN